MHQMPDLLGSLICFNPGALAHLTSVTFREFKDPTGKQESTHLVI